MTTRTIQSHPALRYAAGQLSFRRTPAGGALCCGCCRNRLLVALGEPMMAVVVQRIGSRGRLVTDRLQQETRSSSSAQCLDCQTESRKTLGVPAPHRNPRPKRSFAYSGRPPRSRQGRATSRKFGSTARCSCLKKCNDAPSHDARPSSGK
jgi:hypothetical protein